MKKKVNKKNPGNVLGYLLAFAMVFFSTNAFSQCVNGSSYGSATASASGTVTISSCNYLGEYSAVSGIVAGNSYTFAVNGTPGYISIYSGSASGTLVAHGPSPLTITAAASGTHYAHWNADATCGTLNSCHTTTVTGNNAAPPPPANDDCANATSIACGDTLTGSTVNATADDASSTSGDVWYTITGNGDDITASLCGSSFDTKIRVRDACGGTQVDYNDDFCSTQSQVTWTSVAGTTYLINVSGYGSATGNYSIALSCTPNIVGCMDAAATNYNSAATIACSGCCTYPVTYVQVGQGTAQYGSWTAGKLLSAYYAKGITDITYQACELAATGLVPGDSINSLGFNLPTGGFGTFDATISITDTAGVTTTVWSNTNLNLGMVFGWKDFNFTNSYVWDGGDIVVTVCQTRTSGTSANKFQIHTTATNSIGYYNSNATGSGCALYAGTQSNERPNTRFAYVSGGATYVAGCMDMNASNYNSSATIEDCSCIDPCAGINTESFENANDYGVWSVDQGTFTSSNAWKRLSGATGSTNTGPSAAADSSYYLYCETSGQYNKVGYLNSACIDPSLFTTPSLVFAYHMYGAAMGDLVIKVSSDSGATFTAVDTISGDQGNQWNDKVVALPTSGVVMVQLQYTSGTSFTGDCAVDNMRFMEMPITGCMDQWAPNYNPAAVIDDGSCLYPGCLDPTALNYCTSCNDTNNVLCIYPTCDSLDFADNFEAASLTNWVTADDAQSTVSLVTGSSALADTVSLQMNGGTSAGWTNSYSEATCYSNTSHLSSATYCLDFSNSTSVVNMTFLTDISSIYSGAYAWIRVKVDGTVISDDMGKSSYTNSSSTSLASWVGTISAPTTLTYDLSAYAGQSSVNITFEAACKYTGDIVLIDNINVFNVNPCTYYTTTASVIDDASCNGAADGSAVATATNGSNTVSLSYAWSDGQTADTAVGLAAGTYTCVVTDATNGCVDSVSVTIAEPSSMVLSANVIDESQPLASDGSIDLSVSGGVPCVAVTTGYCTGGPNSTADSEVASVVLNGDAGSAINYTGCPGVSGFNNQLALSASLTSGNTYTVDVNFSTCGGTYSGHGQVWIDYNMDGVYDASEEVGNAAAHTGVNSLTFTVPAGTAAGTTRMRVMQQESAAYPLNPCATYSWGSMIDFTIVIDGGAQPYTYSWSTGGQTIATTEDLSGVGMGYYTVTVTDCNGCTQTGAYLVSLNTVYGCMDATAWNYNSAANINQVSATDTSNPCIAFAYACIDSLAVSYVAFDSLTANTNDPSLCCYVSGCTNPLASNYNALACYDDNSCNYCDPNFTAVAPVSESFESATSLTTGSLLKQLTSDSFNWTRDAYGTGSTATGPQFNGANTWTATTPGAATSSYDSAYYVYIETSTSSALNNTNADLQTACVDVSALANPALVFGYHMYGATINRLEVWINGDSAWSVSGAQGTAWLSASIDLSSYGSNVTATFRAYKGTSFNGDIAIDGVSFEEAPITGCTDPLACNYNQAATLDDGSCFTLAVSLDAASISCSGLSDGSAWVSSNDTTSTFVWSNGATGDSLVGLAAGTYTVTATNSLGCTATDSVVVGDPGSITASFAVVNAYDSTSASGSVDMTVSGGSPCITASSLSSWNSLHTPNGSNGVHFNIVNNSTNAVTITGFSQGSLGSSYGEGSKDMNVYYMPAPYVQTSSAGWTQVATNYTVTVPTGGSTATPVYSGIIPISAVSIPAGATYGFYVGTTIGSIQYATATSTGPAGTVVASDAFIGVSSGHGGTLGSGTFNPRAPVLMVHYGDPNASAYTFVWSTGDTTEDLSAVVAGTHTVSITDCNGCVGTASVVVGVSYVTGCMDSTMFNYNPIANIPDTCIPFIYGCTDPNAYNYNPLANTNQVSVGDPSDPCFSCDTTTNVVIDMQIAIPTAYVTGFNHAQEISWVVTNVATGDTVGMGGNIAGNPYPADNGSATIPGSMTHPGSILGHTFSNLLCLPYGCYAVHMFDSWGDGWAGITYNFVDDASGYVYVSNGLLHVGGAPWTTTYGVDSACFDACSQFAIMSGSATDATCNGGSDGSIDITINDPSGTATYAWSNGATTEDLSGIAAGSYTVVITDVNGCVDSATYAVNEPSAITASMVTVNSSGLADGSIDLTVSGGTPCITSASLSSWNPLHTTNGSSGVHFNIVNTHSGDLTITGFSQGSLGSYTGANNMNVHYMPAPYDNTTSAGWTQVASGVAITVPTGGSAAAPAYSAPFSITPVVIPAGATYGFYVGGTSTVQYSTASATGPAGTVVASNAYLGVTSGHGGTFGSGTFNPRAPVLEVHYGDPNASAYTFAWSNGDTTEDISGLAAGTYCVTITDCDGCTITACDSVSVTLTPGCMDMTAVNYNPIANVSDSSCLYAGCMDITALNYDSTANISCDSTTVNDTTCCVYPCPVVVAPVTEAFSGGILPLSVWPSCNLGWQEYQTLGSGWVFSGTPGFGAASNGRAAGTYAWIDFSSTDVGASLEADDVDISNLTSPVVSFDYFSEGGAAQGLGNPNIMYVEAWDGSSWTQVTMLQLYQDPADHWSNYSFSLAGHSYGSNLVKLRFRGESGGSSYDYYNDLLLDNVSIANGTPTVFGCTDTAACNYNASATANDGSCVASVSISVSATNASCNGIADGSATATANSSTATYSWSNGASGATVSGLAAGTYIVTASEGSCSATDTVVITEPAAIVLSGVVTNATVNGASDGAIDLSVSGGVPCAGATASYCSGGPSSTFDSEVTSVVLNGDAGSAINYTGCPGVSGLNNQLALSASLTSGNTYTVDVNFSTCGGTYSGHGQVWIDWNGDGTFDASEEVGNAAAHTGVNSFTFTVPAGTAAGTTRMRVMQQEGGSYPLNPCATYSWGSMADYSIEIDGGSPPYTIAWNNGASSEDLSGITAGTYSVTVTDCNGCSATASYTVTEPTLSVAGCMDINACNYDSTATVSDGSCTYPGCTDSTQFNYDPTAGCDDGSCIPIIYGCTDSTALNYYAAANTNNGTCVYPIFGCTNPLACNYDSTANVDDGSCNTVYGCTDPAATNYNSAATCDDGSCIISTSCNDPKPTGVYAYDIIDTRAKIHWDNMNSSTCMVWKYFVRYRPVGTAAWTTKSAGVGNGLCNFGLNTQDKLLLNLTPSTTYEVRMKAFYCGGTSSNYSTPVQFTTADPCPPMTNLTVQTFNGNQTKAQFSWDTTGVYVFARVALRVDTSGSAWQTVGGFGTNFPTFTQNKFGLTPGQSYRAQGRTFCNATISAHRSGWTSPIFWTQPGTLIRVEAENTAITNLEVYPNPSRDIFNVSFVSDEVQNLEVSIINVVGEAVYTAGLEQFVGQFTKEVSLATYPKGVYFLEITTDKGVINKKLILQ